MSDSAKKQLTAEEQQFLTSPAGYSQFVKGLASAPAGFKLPQTQVRLLIDQLQALNNASAVATSRPSAHGVGSGGGATLIARPSPVRRMRWRRRWPR